MNPAVWIAILLLFFLLFAGNRRRGLRRRRNRLIGKECRSALTEIIQRMLGKRCVVSLDGTFSSPVTGVLEGLEDNWLSVRTGKNGALELVNLEYVNKITELPEKKK